MRYKNDTQGEQQTLNMLRKKKNKTRTFSW